jgi:hypothetical protein
MHDWHANAKAKRMHRQQTSVQQKQMQENRLVQRALKFYRMNELRKSVSHAGSLCDDLLSRERL